MSRGESLLQNVQGVVFFFSNELLSSYFERLHAKPFSAIFDLDCSYANSLHSKLTETGCFFPSSTSSRIIFVVFSTFCLGSSS